MTPLKMDWKTELKRYAFMVLAAVVYALAMDLFVVPNRIVTGGVTGAATLVSLLTGVGVGAVSVLINIPILLLGLKTQGLPFILRCFLTTTVIGFFIDLYSGLPAITNDPIMAAIYGGVAQGFAVGIFCRYSVSSGGTELLARIVQPFFPSASLAAVLAVLDGIVVLSGSLVMGNPENVLRALIIIFISTKITDLVLTGLDYAKMVYIITDRADEVGNALIHNLPHGVTKLHGTGMYTKVSRNLLFTVIKRPQMLHLKQLVQAADPKALVIVSEATEVLGYGFKEMA